MDKQKRYIDYYLYIYCNNKSHRAEAYLLHLSRTTRFQARCVETVSSISETILAT